MGQEPKIPFGDAPIIRPKPDEPKRTFKQWVSDFSPQVKQGLIVAGVTLVVASVGYLVQYWSFSNENTRLKEQIAAKNEQIADLKQQRDKAELKAKTDEDALAPWVQLANSQFTNTPVTKRLDKLFDAVTSSLAALNGQIPSLAISINGSNFPPYIGFGDCFALTVSVMNIGEYAIDPVTIDVSTTVSDTNTLASGWRVEFPGRSRVKGSVEPYTSTNETELLMQHWITSSARSLESGGTFMAPTIYFTNAFKESDGYTMFPLHVTAHSARSRTVGGTTFLVSPRKGGRIKLLANGVLDIN